MSAWMSGTTGRSRSMPSARDGGNAGLRCSAASALCGWYVAHSRRVSRARAATVARGAAASPGPRECAAPATSLPSGARKRDPISPKTLNDPGPAVHHSRVPRSHCTASGKRWQGSAFRAAIAAGAVLFQALRALAAFGLDEAVEVILAVVVGDLVARRDVPDRRDENLALDDVGLGVGPARVIDVARDVAAGRAVDGPAAADLEQVAGVGAVGALVGGATGPALDYDAALADGLGRDQAEPGSRAGNAIAVTRRNGYHGRENMTACAMQYHEVRRVQQQRVVPAQGGDP